MFYLRSFLVTFWLFLSVALALLSALLYALFRRAKPDINRHLATLFSSIALKIMGIQIEVQGQENLESHQPCIYVANHQSAADVAIFGSVFPPRTLLIAKKELIWLPLFGLYYLVAGNLVIDRKKGVSALRGLEKVARHVRERSTSLFVFPEGTRNPEGEDLLPFKKGAFHLAVLAKVPVVPIVVSPLSPLVNLKKMRMRSGRIQIKILPAIFPPDAEKGQVESLLQQVRQEMVVAFHSLETQERSS